MKKITAGLFVLGAIASVGAAYALLTFGKILEQDDNHFDEVDNEI